jgi:hypothetical protein
MGADLQGPPGWGKETLSLSLPFATVRFNALSKLQYGSLRRAYSDFVLDPHSVSGESPLISDCFAYRLPHSLDIPSESLAVNGQYTPRKVRHAEGIDLTGINFKARIQESNNPWTSLLGVAQEHELAQANVVENFLRVLAAHRSLEQDGILLHSAGLVFDRRAYVFCGKSGAGKTTLTRKAFASGAKVLSDDINVLLPDANSNYHAHAIPFTGEFGRTLNQNKAQDAFPVESIVLLEQGDKLRVNRVTDSQAVAKLLTSCPFVNMDARESESLFDVLIKLVKSVPVVWLQARRDDPVCAIMQAVKKTIAHD